MDPQVLTHFHKRGSSEGQVSEQDLLPDGNTVDVIPDWPAPEGTEVTYYNNGTFRRYRMVSGKWQPIGGDGLSFINYQENSGVSTLTVSGLDLNTDKAYKIFALMSSGTFDDALQLRLNDDNSAAYNEAHTGYPTGNAFSSNNTEISASENTAFRQVQSEMLLSAVGGLPPIMRINTAAVDSLGQPYVIDSAWRWNSAANVTSIRFFSTGNNMQWKIWIYKLTT